MAHLKCVHHWMERFEPRVLSLQSLRSLLFQAAECCSPDPTITLNYESFLPILWIQRLVSSYLDCSSHFHMRRHYFSLLPLSINPLNCTGMVFSSITRIKNSVILEVWWYWDRMRTGELAVPAPLPSIPLSSEEPVKWMRWEPLTLENEVLLSK